MTNNNLNQLFLSSFFNSLLSNTNDYMFIKDINLVYVGASLPFIKLVGKNSVDEIIGKTDNDLFDEELAKKYINDDKTILRTCASTINIIEEIPTKNGVKQFSSTSKYLIRDNHGNIIGIYGIGRDITEEKKLQEIANKANAAKTDFMTRMNHDMRTPMNGLLGLINFSLEEPELAPKIKDNLIKMNSISKYLLNLINDTLDMSRIDSQKFTLNYETINSRDFLEEVLITIRPAMFEKKINFILNTTNVDFNIIKIDKLRVQQILINILSNSVKFTPVGGKVEFILETIRKDSDYAWVKITIRDNGCGMSKEFIPKIFDAFSQEDNGIYNYNGTGLGMSIVKKLLELMGGTINIESTKNVGTTTTINLKFELVHINIDNPKEVNIDIAITSDFLVGKRILLVEDNELNLEIAEVLLQNKGCRIESAINGAYAVQMFEISDIYYYDAILMDIRMPIMDGLEATRRIRKLDRSDALKIPIIAMTANAFSENVKESIAAGMNEHITKPIEPNVLYKTLYKYFK